MSLPKSITIKGKAYSISLESETDDGGNEHQYILLKNGKDERRLSPNTTADELKRYNDVSQRGYEF